MAASVSSRAFIRAIKSAVSEHGNSFYRNPSQLLPHKADYLFQARRLGRTATAFFPFYAFVLGWPWLVSGYYNRFGGM